MNFDHNQSLQEKIAAGCKKISGKTILHTAPHHDDILLSYHAYAIRLLADNQNHIAYITSGSNGVSDSFVVRMLNKVNRDLIEQAICEQVIQSSYAQSIRQFAQQYHDHKYDQLEQCRLFIFIYILTEVFDCYNADKLIDHIHSLQNYFDSKQSGRKDSSVVVQLKERIRESESECKWMISKDDNHNITHLRSTFYHADTHVAKQAMESDIQKLTEYLDRVRPDIITVALDLCGIGPKTHFQSLQIIAKALDRSAHKNIQILGYRNVWSSFDIDVASIIIPVTEQEIKEMESIFTHCFATQKNTIFAGTDADGDFAAQVRYIQQVQWQQVQKKLGSNFMLNDEIFKLSQFVGAIFLQELTLDELLTTADNEFTNF